MKFLNTLVAYILVIGGINWGLVGFFNFNLVNYLFEHGWLDRLIYCIVGICAVYFAFAWPKVLRSR